jgi:1-acyl-sn-glycerol-3-phosphate acyltransferase
MSDQHPIRFSHARMRWLNPVFRLMLRWRFQAILVRGSLDWAKDGLNVLLVQHVGRYDGFVMLQLHRRDAPSSRLISIMLERQLRRFPIFHHIGAVGVEPGSLGSGRTLLQRLRRELVPGDFLAIYPQGRIEAVDADPRRIQTGFRHLMHPSIPTRFQPVALSVEALHHARPTMFVQIGRPVQIDHAADAFAATVHDLRAFLRQHGETAEDHWPGEPLL